MMKNPATAPKPKDEMLATRRLAAAGIGIISVLAAAKGVDALSNRIGQANEIANHIKNPNGIPVSERVDVVAPTGSNASKLSKDLAPDSSSDQASLYGEISNQMQDGILNGTVHVDKSLVEVHPTDVNFIDPNSGQVIHSSEAK